MQSVEIQNHCDLCGDQGSLYGRDKRYDILTCRHCGLLWTNPLKCAPPLSTTNEDYFGEDVYLTNSEAQKNRFRNQLKTFLRESGSSNVKALKVLEVGSGLGFFLDACKEQGIVAEGCDVVERAVRFANRREKRVRLGTLDDHYPDNSFDAIFAFNLIEHLPHPKSFLAQANRILKAGGTLVLETPIQDGLFHRMARAGHLLSGGRLNFYGMEPGGHIYKFSKKTFCKEIGFKTVYQRNIHSPFGEIWGNSSLLTFAYKFVYRWSLPVVWVLARIIRQENRLFVMLGKSSMPQQSIVSTSSAWARDGF